MEKVESKREALITQLSCGDRREITGVDRVLEEMRKDSTCVSSIVGLLLNESPLIRMRAADALEKYSREQPEGLSSYIDFFLSEIADIPQQEIRWHMAQMLPRLLLNKKQRGQSARLLQSYLSDESSIVRTWAMNGLAELSTQDSGLRERVKKLLTAALHSGTPAMKARARKILEESMGQSRPTRR